MGHRAALVAAALAMLRLGPLAAQSTVHANHVTISLVPQLSTVAPNSATGLAVLFEVEPGWHIYFTHPGQSGIPTRVSWQAPSGITVDPLRWPVPQREETDGLISHIYSGRIVLFTSIHLGDVNAPLSLGATVTFGACQLQCVQGKADLELVLPVGASRQNPVWRDFIPAYSTLPALITGLSARASEKEGRLELELFPARAVPSGSGSLTFFPIDPATLDTCVSATPVKKGDTVSFALGRAGPGATRLRGILTGWSGRALRVDVPIEK